MVSKQNMGYLISFLLGIVCGIKRDVLEEEDIHHIFSLLEEEGFTIDEKVLKDIDDVLEKYDVYGLAQKIWNGRKQAFYT